MNFDYMKQYMDSLTDWIIPGNSIVVYKDNQKVFSYQSGWSSVEEKIKMNGRELLNIYSCSKVATVVAALQLFEQGKFLLSDPLYEFIPEFRNMYVKQENGDVKKAENPITMRNLFTMTAGFSYDLELPAFQKARELTGGKMNTVETIRCLAEEPLQFEPGTHWEYSLGHDVLAAAVEVISGKRFSQYMKENIFARLDMQETWYHVTPEQEDRIAGQYLYEVEEKNFVNLQKQAVRQEGVLKNVGKAVSYRFGPEYDSGGAGITTSMDDYAKFAAALANGGTGLTGEKILSRATVDFLRTNQLTGSPLLDFNWPQLVGYGYGLGVRTMIDRAKAGSNGPIGEFGWCGAAGASVLVDPDNKLGVFYAHHMLNPQEEYYQPRLRNVLYACLD